MSTGDKIKALRKERRLTLEQLGNMVGVGKSTVRKWENGMIADIRQTNLARLSAALGTTPEALMGWDILEKQIAEEFPLMNQICNHFGADAGELISLYSSLNGAGKQKVLEMVQDICELPRYKKDGEE